MNTLDLNEPRSEETFYHIKEKKNWKMNMFSNINKQNVKKQMKYFVPSLLFLYTYNSNFHKNKTKKGKQLQQ